MTFWFDLMAIKEPLEKKVWEPLRIVSRDKFIKYTSGSKIQFSYLKVYLFSSINIMMYAKWYWCSMYLLNKTAHDVACCPYAA